MEHGAAESTVLDRAADHDVPARLTLGLTIEAIEAFIAALPADVVKQCNKSRPTIKGKRVPPNTVVNGYVNQWFISQQSDMHGGRAHCERMLARGETGVGIATVFVSWFLATPLKTLVDALRQYLAQHPKLPLDTKFWICDFAIRQSTRKLDATQNDVKKLGECVRTVGHTVLLMEPWDAPMPFKRAYCIKEVWHTLASRAHFAVVMSAVQQAAFERALVEQFDTIVGIIGAVDVRTCQCLSPEDTKAIKAELDREVGLSACNQQVIGLLRTTLVKQGWAALARLPVARRGTSALINNLGMLLKAIGDLDGAEPLLREALEASREKLGDRNPHTLCAIGNLAFLLQAKGDLDGAELLYREALEASREKLGDRHRGTLNSINNLGVLLGRAKGDLDGAEPLLREALAGRRKAFGKCHPDTLSSINNLGGLLHDKGDLDGAEPLYREAMEATRKKLGGRHPSTLMSINNLGKLLHSKGDLDGAEPLLRESLTAMRETLGNRHPDTLTLINNVGQLLEAKGDLKSAEPLYREALEESREVLGDRHLATLISMIDLGRLLQAKGDLDGAEPLYRETMEARCEALGERHPATLTSINDLGGLLCFKGDLDGAEPLLREALGGRRKALGYRHPDTLTSLSNLSQLMEAKSAHVRGAARQSSPPTRFWL